MGAGVLGDVGATLGTPWLLWLCNQRRRCPPHLGGGARPCPSQAGAAAVVTPPQSGVGERGWAHAVTLLHRALGAEQKRGEANELINGGWGLRVKHAGAGDFRV